MGEFRMPSLGADMEAGTLMEWRVKPGDNIKRGDIIAEVETDKGLIEVEAFETGVVDQLLIEPGTKLPVGTVLATIRGEGEVPKPAAVPAPAAPAAKREAAPSAAPKPVPEGPKVHVRASPLARKLAAELGVDLATVHGTGPGGAIERADVENAAAKKPAAPTPALEVPDFHIRMRRAIAAAMARSNREVPHYYLETQIDMSRALRWLEAQNQKRPIKERLLPVVLLLKAVQRAITEVPDLNGYWVDDHLDQRDAVHIGFAISVRQGGLITPAIHDVQNKNLGELMAAIHDLIPRARAGRLRSSELSDATITVTSLGDLGVRSVYGVIYPPQVALVGFGKITDQPWAENGMLGVRPILTATLAADHRATDGHRGAQFLEALNRYLQEPEKL
ncbi:dihydrolipoamide acetyltransferase family protein [Verrucomicrobiota bacterium sgz303538]